MRRRLTLALEGRASCGRFAIAGAASSTALIVAPGSAGAAGQDGEPLCSAARPTLPIAKQAAQASAVKPRAGSRLTRRGMRRLSLRTNTLMSDS
jgi:hypothetical protein